MKIAISTCYGGYGYSKEFLSEYPECDYLERNDKHLIECLEKYGSVSASSWAAYIEIVTIPDEATDWRIDEYDGRESVTYVLHGKLYKLYGA